MGPGPSNFSGTGTLSIWHVITNNEPISDALRRILAEISPKMYYFCKLKSGE